ncbi:D-TA family PLP-dependent enzyme [Mesorhizobium sp. BAC0120]|uniref:D-TA family PLP-dependent enzyme n=1 Tax=Mesorhizobium sp. BAC0120 TaxID=3090670 RepID=UPI00298BEBF0|nr:D-TA family PLP-dependent enzyme [Mesorhizobium sp. BAC0120]MDW6023998.1 D-TA family PLP-dependent enzyme [Mesorhizobium sp. BAC0120]
MNARPRTVDEIDTPAVLIDLDRALANIARAQAHADAAEVKLRPHIKTHKLPFFARKQVEAGAVGITCQKIGEAEVMADAGLVDIFLPYNILGRQKLARLKALHDRVTLSVTADSATTLAGLAETFADKRRPLKVLIECDTGGGRCGVQDAEEALALARQIAGAQGLAFGGLMTYPAAGHPAEAEERLVTIRDRLAGDGLACEIVTSGGTPDMWRNPDRRIVTEYRPGTYIYMDRYQVGKGATAYHDCALTVLATVVSHPTPTRAILDSGSKALSSDTLGLPDHGELVGVPGARVTALSEEHAKVELSGDGRLKIGERVRVLPDHACVVTNLFDEVHLISGERVVDILPVAARGRMG